jgi:hypothetical protein
MLNQPLSAEEIIKVVPNCKFIPYHHMKDINHINQLLPRTLILYELDKIGHFCCIFTDKLGVINFFDPIGLRPDAELKLVNPMYKKLKHEDITYLLDLLKLSGQRIEYNDYPLQMRGTSTCGRWVTIRLLNDSLTCDQFGKYFMKFPPIEREQLIIEMTKKYF